MKTALVLGVNGQDGSFVADILLERGEKVIGVGLQKNSRWLDPTRFTYVSMDAAEADALTALLVRTQPDHIFHMAAIHGSAGHAYEAAWRHALSLNVGSVHTCLEFIRRDAPHARLLYPSSLKVFGDPPPPEVDERTPRVSSCLYSITKNAATDLIHQYRAKYGVWANVVYYFNHDSPRRPDSYFLPRLAAGLAARARGDANAPWVASLDFWCDWGNSREFMELTVDLLNLEKPVDVVMATGEPIHASELARTLAVEIGVTLDVKPRTEQAPPVRARLDVLRQSLGRLPTDGALDVARWILASRQGLSGHGQASRA